MAQAIFSFLFCVGGVVRIFKVRMVQPDYCNPGFL